MKHIVRRHKSFVFSLSLLAAVIVVGFVITEARKPTIVQAGPSQNFTGFAWSDMPNGSDECMVGAPGCGGNTTNLSSGRGAGWISFNSSDIPGSLDYGVNVDAAGAITGNAWSEHVGWISFDITGGCPGGTCAPNINMTTGAFSGWARAVAGGTAESGGWDGWISLSNNGLGGPAYGVTVSPVTGTGIVSGYAWGGDVLGWIDFTGVEIEFPPVLPPLTLTVNPPCSTTTDLVYASPASTPFTNCTITSSPTTGVDGDSMPADYPLPIASNQIISGIPISAPSITFTLTCTGTGVPVATVDATATLCTPQPAASLSGPACFQTAPSTGTLVWSSSNVTSCSIDHGIGTVGTSGTQSVTISGTTTYNLTCTGPYGPANSSHTITVDPSCINPGTGPGGPITPIFEEV